MNVHTFLTISTKALQRAGIETARLDSLVLAEHVLSKNRAWLLAHPKHNFSLLEELTLQALVKKRTDRQPVAYLVGYKEFYGRVFTVTPDVLIPRPETEALIEAAKKLQPATIIDVGTGSGAIAITLALETNAQVRASDISKKALDIAQKNARAQNANITFIQSDLLSGIAGQFDCIVANLPYVSRNWQRSPETLAEPEQALLANNGGLELIYKLITQAPARLTTNGHLILEADPRQHPSIQKAASEHGFVHTASDGFMLCFRLNS